MADQSMQAPGGPTQHRFDSLTEQLQRQYVAPAVDSVRDVMHERPVSSALAVFGAGFAVGLMLAGTLASSSMVRRRPPSAMERFGEQVYDALSRVLPESLANQLER